MPGPRSEEKERMLLTEIILQAKAQKADGVVERGRGGREDIGDIERGEKEEREGKGEMTQVRGSGLGEIFARLGTSLGRSLETHRYLSM